jgi:hypothetical protein
MQSVGSEKRLSSCEVGVEEDVYRDEEEEVSVMMCFLKVND